MRYTSNFNRLSRVLKLFKMQQNNTMQRKRERNFLSQVNLEEGEVSVLVNFKLLKSIRGRHFQCGRIRN